MSRRLWSLCLVLAVTACATPEATWKSVPESQIRPERGWTIVVNAIAERFDVETSDAQSGYLRTSWKVTRKDLFGTATQRTRVITRLEERTPFKVKVKVEMQKVNPWTGEWQDAGNDPRAEQEIMQDLAGRLRT